MFANRTRLYVLALALAGTLVRADEPSPEERHRPWGIGPALHDDELRAADVDAYVDAYRHRAADNRVEYDGVRRPLSFIGFEEYGLVLEYGDGVMLVDIEDGEASGPFTLLEGDVTRIGDGEEAFLGSVTRRLSGDDFEVHADEDFDEERFDATATDDASGETVTVSGATNDSLVYGGRVFFDVDGEDLHVSGLLGARAYAELEALLEREPGIRRLVFDDVRGSLDDAINLHIGRLVRAAGLATHVPANGRTVSGGSDLFVAGVERSVEPGGVIGVHAGCCTDGKGADELPRSHPAHAMFVDFHEQMLGEGRGEAFHFFTVEAAPFDAMHDMTREELVRFGVVTN